MEKRAFSICSLKRGQKRDRTLSFRWQAYFVSGATELVFVTGFETFGDNLTVDMERAEVTVEVSTFWDGGANGEVQSTNNITEGAGHVTNLHLWLLFEVRVLSFSLHGGNGFEVTKS